MKNDDRVSLAPRGGRLSSRLRIGVLGAACWLAIALARTALGQIDIEREPINYSHAPHADPAGKLDQRLRSGRATLACQPQHGYLPALLHALGISRTSQVLVFSKTSFQRSLIAPKQPRAIYFNDDSYVGFVQGGEVLEVSSIDPHLGAIFYSFARQQAEHPNLLRQRDDCLQCHQSALTGGVPGLMVRSVYPGRTSEPILRAGSFRTSDESPLFERWGGWYVTGTHGQQRHMGNAILRGDDPAKLDREQGANLTDLGSRFDTSPYLTPYSDIVALMVLEHQVGVHNQFTLAGYQALLAAQEQAALNQLDGKPPGSPIESIERRYQWIADAVLKCLLFAHAARLTDEVRGNSGFAEYFAALGPTDRRGRSLRQFDLHTRLFRYPCSYLIYSAAYAELPQPVKARIDRGLWQVLTGQDTSADFKELSLDDRRAIYEILTDTRLDLPAYWATAAPR